MARWKFQRQAYSPQNYSLEQTTLTAVKSAMEVHLQNRGFHKTQQSSMPKAKTGTVNLQHLGSTVCVFLNVFDLLWESRKGMRRHENSSSQGLEFIKQQASQALGSNWLPAWVQAICQFSQIVCPLCKRPTMKSLYVTCWMSALHCNHDHGTTSAHVA